MFAYNSKTMRSTTHFLLSQSYTDGDNAAAPAAAPAAAAAAANDDG